MAMLINMLQNLISCLLLVSYSSKCPFGFSVKTLNPGLRFLNFFFFFFPAALFDQVNREQCICALFTDQKILLFSNFFIKKGSHDTIHTFKNYFATVFSDSATISSIQTDPNSTSPIKHGGG